MRYKLNPKVVKAWFDEKQPLWTRLQETMEVSHSSLRNLLVYGKSITVTRTGLSRLSAMSGIKEFDLLLKRGEE